MESASPKAVFLSYAREDTAAAQRIAEALRSHGVEVWFDQNELRGGDAWDAKIRKQIRECTLFVPIISARTQERAEGYFRREWKLGVERTHDIAAGIAFVVPVVIDDTLENGAMVPDEFMRVQWIRLSGALPTIQFVEQVKRLLVAPRKSAAESKAYPGSGSSSPTVKVRSGFPALALVALGALAVGLGAYILLRPSAKETPAATSQAAASPEPSVSDKSIAVLPFENMSEDKANAYFCDGVQEDILTNLANIAELRVVSRTSVEQYRGTTKPIRQIAQELGVAWVLEGSVQREGNKVRVTGQLINAATDEHKWAKAYDRDLNDIFAIQSELAQTIAASLQAAVSPQENDLITQRPTENMVAYDLVLRARELGEQPVLNSNFSAWFRSQERLLESAIQIDPNYAAAYADLGFLYAFSYFAISRADIDLAKAKEAVDTAIRLAPNSPDVIRALGDYYYYGQLDYARAMEQYQKAERIRPNDPVLYARIAAMQRRQGRWAESLASFRNLESLDPGNTRNVRDTTVLLAAGRRFDEAIANASRNVGRLPDDLQAGFDLAYLYFIASGSTREMERFITGLSATQANSEQGLALRKFWALRHGDIDEAIRLDRGSPPDDDTAIDMAVALAVHGDGEAARVRLGNYSEELRSRTESAANLKSDSLWAFGIDWARRGAAEALLGHKDEALRCAHKAVDVAPESREALRGATCRAYLAFVYAWTGDKDAAVAEYAQLLRTPFCSLRGGGANFPDATINVMKVDPVYAPLRGYPAFEALLNDPKNNEPLF
jgi:TolB-like protein/Tfp pilus assembly protein PilF